MRSSLVALLVASGACADDVPGLPTTTSDTEGEDTTTTSVGPTTIDPDTTGVMTMGTMGSDSSTTAETSESSSTGPGEMCGNGKVEGDEDCDGTDLGGADCESEGFASGRLACDDGCVFDTSGCMNNKPVCGDDMIEAPEDCDGTDLGGEDCESQGFLGGRLACANDCTLDTTGCSDRICGNDMIEGAEECDGMNLGGEDCGSQGFDGGTLACANDCAFDLTGCTNITCGNGVTEAGETCDGADLEGETCLSQGFGGGGVLACQADCLAFNTTGCMNVPCTHDICVQGELLVSGCDPCVTQICALDPFCCDTQWDLQCVTEVNTICGLPACAVCGNGVVDAGETCDGAALAGEDCITQGFDGGTLACAANCLAYDTATCSNFTGDCCAAHPEVGCDDAACTAAICGPDPFCCNSNWDAACANAAVANAACQGVGGSCPGGGSGDCCAAHAGTGCDDATCEASVCALDAFCCNNNWDAQCANEAIADPNCQGVGGSCPGGGGFACSEQDLGSTIGAAVAAGNTAGSDNDLDPSCGLGNANDHVMTFTAPAAGQYTFNTNGSTYDTLLSLLSNCTTELACDDDSGIGTQSLLVRNMAAGEVILILVDGYNGATGNWTLNITSP
jgi:hypothetical protein